MSSSVLSMLEMSAGASFDRLARILAWLSPANVSANSRLVSPMTTPYTSATSLSRSSISTTSARVRSGGVPGGMDNSISRKRSAPDGKSVIGITAVSPRLAAVRPKATTSVTTLCRSVHVRIGVYARCIHVSCTRISSSSPTSSGRSPGRSRYAPRTGTAVRATKRDAISAKLTVSAKGEKNAPTRPCMNARGANTTTVAIVDAKMAGPTSAVASRAARHRSLPPWMCL